MADLDERSPRPRLGAGADGRQALIDSVPAAPAVIALMAMLEAVSPDGAVELERALSARLRVPEPTPAQQRVAELFALAQLLESELAFRVPRHPLAPVQVSQENYDRTRPEGAPTAETLISRYGGAASDGWAWACRAAWGLLPDGRKTRPGLGWAPKTRGRPRPDASTRDQVLADIRACAFALLRRPSSHAYVRWSTSRRQRARRTPGGGGGELSARNLRGPVGMAAVYQHFPRGWSSALAAANITDEDLVEQRRQLAAAGQGVAGEARNGAGHRDAEAKGTGLADRLQALSDEQLAALRLTPAQRDRLARRGCDELPLPQAIVLARLLGCSLERLAGLDAGPEEPPAEGVALDVAEIRARAKAAGLRLDAVAARARLGVPEWRALIAHKRDPTLGQLTKMASALRCGPSSLCS